MPVHFRQSADSKLTACGIDYDKENVLVTHSNLAAVDCPRCKNLGAYKLSLDEDPSPTTVHYVANQSKVYTVCGERAANVTMQVGRVTCLLCRATSKFKADQRGMPMPLADILAEARIEIEDTRRVIAESELVHLDWGMGATRCGKRNGTRSVLIEDATCPDCIELNRPASERIAERVGQPTLHTPPRMEDERGLTDGVFIFHGTHSDLGGQMEVVPMTTGNVEFTISPSGNTDYGIVFNLSHLDRLDLIRALLHDFHYSPETGGPDND